MAIEAALNGTIITSYCHFGWNAISFLSMKINKPKDVNKLSPDLMHFGSPAEYMYVETDFQV